MATIVLSIRVVITEIYVYNKFLCRYVLCDTGLKCGQQLRVENIDEKP
jgi:hypothetical protein